MSRTHWITCCTLGFLGVALCLWLFRGPSAENPTTPDDPLNQSAPDQGTALIPSAKGTSSPFSPEGSAGSASARVGGRATEVWPKNPMPLLPLPSGAASGKLRIDPEQLVWSGRPRAVSAPGGLSRRVRLLKQGTQIVIAESVWNELGDLRVLRVADGSLVWRRSIPRGIRALETSPDSRWVAIGIGDHEIALLDASTGREHLRLKGHVEAVQELIFSADSTRLLTAAFDRTVALWDLTAGNLLARASLHPEGTRAIGFSLANAASNRQPRVLACANNGTRKWWKLTNGLFVEEAGLPKIDPPPHVASSPDGLLLAIVDQTGELTLQNGSTGEVIQVLETHSETAVQQPRSFVVGTATPSTGGQTHSEANPAGDQLADRPALAEKPPGRPMERLLTQERIDRMSIFTMRFAPDGSLLAVARMNGDITLWTTSDGKIKATLRGHQFPAHDICFSRDNSQLASASQDGAVITWRLNDASEIRRVIPASDSVRNGSVSQFASISADGRLVVLPRNAGGADVVNTQRPLPMHRLAASESAARTPPAVADPSHVRSSAVSADGQFAAIGRDDGGLTVWPCAAVFTSDPQTAGLQPLFHLALSDSSIDQLAFGRPGLNGAPPTLLAALGSGEVASIHLGTREVKRSASFDKGRQKRLAVSPRGDLAALATEGNVLRILELPSLRERATIETEDPVFSLAFDPSGRRLAGGLRGRVVLWNVSDGKILKTYQVPTQAEALEFRGNTNLMEWAGRILLKPSIDVLLFSASGQRLIASTAHGVSSWLVDQPETPRFLPLHVHNTAVAVRGDGALFAATQTGHVDRWLPSLSIPPAPEANRHQGACRFVLVTPDAKTIVTGGMDNKLRLWSPDKAEPLHELTTGNGRGIHGAMSGDGRFFACCAYGTGVELWDVKTRKLIRRQYGHAKRVQALALSPDGKRLASADVEGNLLIRDTTNGRTLLKLPAQELPVTRMDWSPDGSRLVTGTGDLNAWHLTGRIRTWDASTGKLLLLIDEPLGRQVPTFSPDGKFLLSSGGDNDLRIWDTATGSRRAQIPYDNGLRGYTLMAGGRLLVAVEYPNQGFIHDSQSGELLCRFQVPTTLVWGVAAALQADWFATVGNEGQLHVWRVPLERHK